MLFLSQVSYAKFLFFITSVWILYVFLLCYANNFKKKTNYSLYLSSINFFIKINIDAKNIIKDNICDIRTFPSIRLSVLRPSITNLANEYTAKYASVICPLYFLFFEMIINIINNANVIIDSYKNVG